MRLGNIIFCFALMAALTVASGDAADSPLRIEVSPRISSAPAVVRIRAIVTPDAANRVLHIVVDSGSYYRSSMVPLDGANAAAVTETTFKNIPGGDYEVTVALVDASGRPRTMDRREVTVSASPLSATSYN
jgi:hypothetical protein